MPPLAQKSSPSVLIVPPTQTPLSKDQKTFNNLIKKIDARRARLAEWETAIPLFHRQYASDLLPLHEQEMDLQGQLAQALDRAFEQRGVTKGERRKLAGMIVDLAEAVLGRREDEALKALFNKHSQSDFDAEEAAQLDGMKSMLEEVFGVELGDDVDMRSPDEVFQRMEDYFQAQHEEWEAQQASRRQSAREQAREARQAAEAKQMSQSIREVYRKLASALHPDRESDPAERQRKTELMQRANEAYEKGNLLQLLELQLALEHIDPTHLAAVGPERLRRYIKILKGQLSDLDLEIERVEQEFAHRFGLATFDLLDPKRITALLVHDVAGCKQAIRQLQAQLRVAGDLVSLKAWLKMIRLQRRREPDFDIPF